MIYGIVIEICGTKFDMPELEFKTDRLIHLLNLKHNSDI